jgi:hypothetical protein
MVVKKAGTSVVTRDDFAPVRRPPVEGLPDSMKAVFDAFGGTLVSVPVDWDLVEKGTLVGKPFVIWEFTFGAGDYGEYVTVFAVTEDGQRIMFSDGSTGIARQLKTLADANIMGGISCSKGLRPSHYDYDDHGTKKPATTYYLTV